MDGIPEPAGWRDPLTGLEGPDAWQRMLVAEVARTARYARPLTVVVLEVEGAAELGEEIGGDAGREILREVARGLERASRTTDVVVRIGVTRFGVILSETDEVAAINYVERVRDAVLPKLPALDGALRLSFGWASPLPGDSADALVRRADHRMMHELLR